MWVKLGKYLIHMLKGKKARILFVSHLNKVIIYKIKILFLHGVFQPERKAGPLLPLPDLSGPDRYSFNHYNLVDVINLCYVGCLRPTDN